jgi:hypothetical protein
METLSEEPMTNKIDVAFETLLGKTLTNIHVCADPNMDNRIVFILDDDSRYLMYHRDDCCESVSIEDICGDIDDLIGTPILLAEEEINNNHESGEDLDYGDTSTTWTFYKLSTIKGSVTIRWLGTSNGYYSESVDFVKLEKN